MTSHPFAAVPRHRIAAALGLALTTLPLSALAVDTPTGARASLEEVVVTAQRRTESLQDTPISIQAFSSEQLELKGIVDLVDLHSHVPNFQIAPHPSTSTSIRTFMRGVGNNDDQITQDPSVAVYMDGAYIARIHGLAVEVAEISRIEVLRGPQGTLFGRNATGGAINFISRAPDVEALAFRQTLGAGNRDLFRSHTRLNLPVMPGKLGVQLSYLKHEKDGFIDNAGAGVSRFGDRNREAFRADALWQINDQLQARYAYDRSGIRDTPQFVDAVSLDESPAIPDSGSPFERNLRRDDVSAEGHSLTLSWDLSDRLNLKSMSTYRELESTTDRNYLTDVIIPGAPLTGSGKIVDQDQFSQEFQLTGDAANGRLQYVAGAYYFEESASDTALRGSSRSAVTFVTADNKAYALFAQGTYTPGILDERLHVTLGGRWSRDERDATTQQGTVDGGLVGVPVAGSNSYSNFAPTLVLAYDLADDINAYAKVSRGYKSGGFNLRASSDERFSEGFDEESLTAWELGVKSEFLDRRVRLNAAAFYSDYRDIQINTRSDPLDLNVTDVLNAGEARITGLEFELTALLTDALSVNFNYGYLDPEFKEIIGADGVDRADEVSPINSPRHSYTADINYRFPAAGFGTISANVGYTWQDDMITSTSNPDFVVGAYGLLNARLTLSELPAGRGDLRLSLWGKNLRDEDYYLALFSVVRPAAYYGEPRSYGIDLTWEF